MPADIKQRSSSARTRGRNVGRDEDLVVVRRVLREKKNHIDGASKGEKRSAVSEGSPLPARRPSAGALPDAVRFLLASGTHRTLISRPLKRERVAWTAL